MDKRHSNKKEWASDASNKKTENSRPSKRSQIHQGVSSMLQFLESCQKSIHRDRKQHSGCLGRKLGGNWLQETRGTLWNDKKVFCLECWDFMGTFIWQISWNLCLKWMCSIMCELYLNETEWNNEHAQWESSDKCEVEPPRLAFRYRENSPRLVSILWVALPLKFRVSANSAPRLATFYKNLATPLWVWGWSENTLLTKKSTCTQSTKVATAEATYPPAKGPGLP